MVSILSDNKKKKVWNISRQTLYWLKKQVKSGVNLSDNEGAEYSALAEDIKQTIDEVVPKKKNMFKNGRSISEETKKLYEQRKKEFSKGNQDETARKKWNKK